MNNCFLSLACFYINQPMNFITGDITDWLSYESMQCMHYIFTLVGDKLKTVVIYHKRSKFATVKMLI